MLCVVEIETMALVMHEKFSVLVRRLTFSRKQSFFCEVSIKSFCLCEKEIRSMIGTKDVLTPGWRGFGGSVLQSRRARDTKKGNFQEHTQQTLLSSEPASFPEMNTWLLRFVFT